MGVREGGREGGTRRWVATLALQSLVIFEDMSSKYQTQLGDREVTSLFC